MTSDIHGVRLAIVMGNHAPGGMCPFAAAGRCHHCDIGLGEGHELDVPMNLRRLRWLRAYYGSELETVEHLLVYNSGSTLNPRELPWEVTERIVTFSARLENLRVLSLESRELFVTEDVVVKIAELLGPGKELRVILGLESGRGTIRNGLLQKGMRRAAVQSAVDTLRLADDKSCRRGKGSRVGVTFNVLIGAPGTTPQTTVEEAVDTALVALELTRGSGMPADLNLHPYYPGRRGRLRFPAHPRPSLTKICRAAIEIAKVTQGRGALYLGLEDEGHDQDQEHRAEQMARLAGAASHFNRTGSTAELEVLLEREQP